MPVPLLVAKNRNTELHLLPALGNRHGLIGVPLFVPDVIGDLSGMREAPLARLEVE